MRMAATRYERLVEAQIKTPESIVLRCSNLCSGFSPDVGRSYSQKKLLNLERSQQNRADESKHGAHSQNIQTSQSKVHGDASLVELGFVYHETAGGLSLRPAP